MPRLAVYLLGPPRVERDGVAVWLDRRKAIALLAYLAVTGQSHRRDSLVNLLWPDCDTTTGRAALRRTLHALSAAIGADWLDTGREEIGLNPGADLSTSAGHTLWVDVEQFHRHLAVAGAAIPGERPFRRKRGQIREQGCRIMGTIAGVGRSLPGKMVFKTRHGQEAGRAVSRMSGPIWHRSRTRSSCRPAISVSSGRSNRPRALSPSNSGA